MNMLWVPVCTTLVIVTVVIWDMRDDWDKFKKEWPLALLALSIKPGMLLFAIWFIWLKVLL